MHFGLLFLGLLSGVTAAVASFSLGGGMLAAIICYTVFGFGAVCFAALIWAIGPARQPIAMERQVPPFFKARE